MKDLIIFDYEENKLTVISLNLVNGYLLISREGFSDVRIFIDEDYTICCRFDNSTQSLRFLKEYKSCIAEGNDVFIGAITPTEQRKHMSNARDCAITLFYPHIDMSRDFNSLFKGE